MFKLTRKTADNTLELVFNQDKFYSTFIRDLRYAQTRVIIESPFITTSRLDALMPTLLSLQEFGVRIVVNTKPLYEHSDVLRGQAFESIAQIQKNGINVACSGRISD